jgi:hypothetical protein
MHDHHEHQPTMSEKVNTFVAWAQCIAMPLELFFRRPGTAGERYFAGRTFIGIFLMMVIVALVGGEGRGFYRQQQNPYGLQFGQEQQTVTAPSYAPGMYDGAVIAITFFGALLMFAMHKGQEKANAKKGIGSPQSLYTGTSWFGADDWKAKTVTEPGVAILLGMVCFALSTGLAAYLMIAGLCLGLTASHQKAEHDARIRAMKDARAEQEIYMEEFRNGREE